MIRTLALLAALAFLPATAAAQCPGCTVSYYGAGCGPDLTVSLRTRNPSVVEIGVHFRNGNPNGVALLVLGTEQLNLTLPGTLCSIYTDFVYGHFIQIRGDGAFDWRHPWPNGNPGHVFVQVADFNRHGSVFTDIRLTRGARAQRDS